MKDLPISEIEAETPFITSNRRLAVYVHGEYDRLMQKNGKMTWKSPAIIPWQAWLEKMRTASRPDKPLMPELAAQSLWEEIVGSDPLIKDGEILVEGGVIKSAYDAYALTREYKLTLPAEDIYASREVKALAGWIRSYGKKLAELGFEERLNLADEIALLIKNGEIKPPGKMILAGFDELTPQHVTLVEALEQKGCRVVFWPCKPDKVISAAVETLLPDSVKLELFEDELEEVIHAARWIRKTYRPGMRIGIIVPALGQYKDMIKREFAAELAPSSILPPACGSPIVNISLGDSLSDSPVVRFALNILSLDGRRQELELISSILLSPFAGTSDGERLYLAGIDCILKKENRLTVTVPELASMIGPDSAPNISSLLGEVEKVNKEKRQLLYPSGWSRHFDLFLKSFVHPVGMWSEEYQALGALKEVFSAFASLDDITGPIDRSNALRRLKKITLEKIHQPETEESPIEVMGMLESSGLAFDHVRLIGAHDKALPGEPAPNPFIPPHLQKEHHLPRSSYERELAFASIQLRRIISCAGSFSASAPASLNKVEAGISTMFSGAEIVQGKGEGGESSRHMDRVHESVKAEFMPEEMVLPLHKDELERLRGGTSILKNQSDCPFRAFAVHRLYSGAIDEPEAGLTSMERGNIVHKAMELFWEKAKGSAGLRKLIDEGKLDGAIADAAQEGLRKAAPKRKLGKRYMDIELARLVSLLNEWLQIEKERDQFSVSIRESEKEIDVAGLPLSARIDRVDELGGGEKALIDYKTGGGSGPNDWLTGRPKEPQLMLYAMSGKYDAVTFAKLKRGESCFAGIAREGGFLPGIKPFGSDNFSKKTEGIEGWDQLMDEWRKTVEGLGEGFMKGEAGVNPRDYGKEDSACRYCDQAPLCRIFEASP